MLSKGIAHFYEWERTDHTLPRRAARIPNTQSPTPEPVARHVLNAVKEQPKFIARQPKRPPKITDDCFRKKSSTAKTSTGTSRSAGLPPTSNPSSCQLATGSV
jgi:hypothetical protein